MSVGGVEFPTVAALISPAVMDGLGRKKPLLPTRQTTKCLCSCSLGQKRETHDSLFGTLVRAGAENEMSLSELYILICFETLCPFVCVYALYGGGQWSCEFGVGCSRDTIGAHEWKGQTLAQLRIMLLQQF